LKRGSGLKLRDRSAWPLVRVARKCHVELELPYTEYFVQMMPICSFFLFSYWLQGTRHYMLVEFFGFVAIIIPVLERVCVPSEIAVSGK
jgi:hypothetical protein